MYQHFKKMSEQSTSVLLLLLLCSDIVFNLLHILQHTLVSISAPNYVYLGTALEVYHLIKLFWIVVLFVYLLKVTQFPGYLPWVLVFSIMLIDDAFLVHQKVGLQVANWLDTNLPVGPNLPPRLFEFIVLAAIGFLLLLIVAWAYFYSTSTFRKITHDLLIFILALFFFGVIVDLAAALNLGHGVIMGFVIIEDAGEMVVFSMILWYVFLLVNHNGKPDYFLVDLFRKP